MAADPKHPIARAIRTARVYADMSRSQLGAAIGRSGYAIGDWERGEWKAPPPDPMLEGIIKATRLSAVLAAELFRLQEDPAKRFAATTRREAERTDERPSSEPRAPSAEDEEDVGP